MIPTYTGLEPLQRARPMGMATCGSRQSPALRRPNHHGPGRGDDGTQQQFVLLQCGTRRRLLQLRQRILAEQRRPIQRRRRSLFTTSSLGSGQKGYSINPINLFGDGSGNTYEFSYGEDNFSGSGPSYGGTQIEFSVGPDTNFQPDLPGVAPEPSFYGTVVSAWVECWRPWCAVGRAFLSPGLQSQTVDSPRPCATGSFHLLPECP